ncbi:MAG: sulfatase [Planctomycetaceae bacterium]
MLTQRTLTHAFVCLVAAGAWHPATDAADEPGANRPLNVLMIAVDDLRPDIGCYGNSVVKTPNIDRLAARGVVFGRAYCQQAVCSPSRTSLMTGQRPDATRVFDLKTHFRTALPDCVTLPQHFKAHGYHCAALSKIYHRGYEDGRSWSEPHWYPNGKSIDTDPDDWTQQTTRKVGEGVEEYAAETPRADSGKGPATEVSAKADDELPDGFTAAEAVRRIATLAAGEKPFFLAVGFLKPHLPFVAPKKYWDLYDPAAIPTPAIDQLPDGAPSYAGHSNGEIHQYLDIPPGDPLPADVARRLRHGYYACISYTDAQVGRLLDALDAAGIADRTVVVLWGDHGWQLGDHGLWHKHTNFELATRAPLIIATPGCAAGATASAPVEFVDVYPTLVDACSVPPAGGLAGASLVPLLRDPQASVKPVAISQYPRSKGESGTGPVMGYSVRDDRWRFTAWREDGGSRIVATELYDEREDPAETRNLAADPQYKAVVDRLSGHLPPPGPATPKSEKANRKKVKPAAS